jgi:hypothetical protein
LCPRDGWSSDAPFGGRRERGCRERRCRAQGKEVQEHLGYSSITVTFDHYGHLFPENLDRLADGLEETFRRSETVWRRSEGNAEVIKLPVSEEELASDPGE